MRSEQKNSTVREVGSAWIWLSALCIALALALLFGLLLIIFLNGTSAFWPRHVYEAELWDGSRIVGQIISKDRSKESGERQLWFVGNDTTKAGRFLYIVSRDVKELRKASEYHVMEPESGGRIFGVVLNVEGALVGSLADEGHSENDEDRFLVTWREARSKISSARLLEQEARRKLRAGSGSGIDQELMQRIQRLKDEASVWKLIYRTPDGREGRVLLAEIIEIEQISAMNFWEKLFLYLTRWVRFLTTEPRVANTEGGIFPAIFGTFLMTILMSMAVVPFGVMAAIYLREYATPGPLLSTVRVCVNNLAGVPSIVFGVFGLGFFVYLVGGTIDDFFFTDRKPSPVFGTGTILWASLTLALLTLPVVIVATEEALGAVSRGLREAALACGATKWQVISRVVLPAALPGVLTGLILAMARGAGEVAPLMITGVVKLAPDLPLDGVPPFLHLERKFMHLGFHIYDLGFQSPDSDAARPVAFASTLVLILLVGLLNLAAVILRENLRRSLKSSTF